VFLIRESVWLEASANGLLKPQQSPSGAERPVLPHCANLNLGYGLRSRIRADTRRELDGRTAGTRKVGSAAARSASDYKTLPRFSREGINPLGRAGMIAILVNAGGAIISRFRSDGIVIGGEVAVVGSMPLPRDGQPGGIRSESAAPIHVLDAARKAAERNLEGDTTVENIAGHS
jgi:hypothetical protein